MLRQWSVARMSDELGVLEASAVRAGAALGRVRSSLWEPRTIDAMRLVLGATVIGSLAALAALAAFAF
jgi:7,8-dihydro-6-hydroxymethylpterin-pyrophosphokinase